jgi:hypothetical protein
LTGSANLPAILIGCLPFSPRDRQEYAVGYPATGAHSALAGPVKGYYPATSAHFQNAWGNEYDAFNIPLMHLGMRSRDRGRNHSRLGCKRNITAGVLVFTQSFRQATIWHLWGSLVAASQPVWCLVFPWRFSGDSRNAMNLNRSISSWDEFAFCDIIAHPIASRLDLLLFCSYWRVDPGRRRIGQAAESGCVASANIYASRLARIVYYRMPSCPDSARGFGCLWASVADVYKLWEDATGFDVFFSVRRNWFLVQHMDV